MPITAAYALAALAFAASSSAAAAQSGGFSLAGTPREHKRHVPVKYNTTSGPMPGKINIHIQPHSHQDVGWLKTFDEYLLGRNNSIQHAGVQWVYYAVVSSLLANPDRKFIAVEQGFFSRWLEQAPELLADVQTLLASGQLSFINGGWCMHDEATVDYISAIDNMALGHRHITEAFGVDAVPRTQWQIDPFGHSSAQAAYFTAGMGSSSMFFGRLDFQDLANRRATNATEFVWQASASLGDQAAIFAGINVHGYDPPTISDANPVFEWDINADNAHQPALFGPVNDNPTIDGNNVLDYVNATLYLMQQHAAYIVPDSDGTINLAWQFGTDFNYEGANEWFHNIDKLIHYINLNTSIHGVNMFYSTPMLYADAKLAQQNEWPVKTDDFFPYSSNPHWYWTGFFTSRPALKGFVRESTSLFTALRQMQAVTGGVSASLDINNPLYGLEHAVATLQHHDAVSGTERQHVAYDYAKLMTDGRLDAQMLLSYALSNLTTFQGDFSMCELNNATICPALEAGTPTVMILYNARSQAVSNVPVRVSVGLPSGVASWSVVGSDGVTPLTAQLLPLSAEDSYLRDTYYSYDSATPVQWLAFQVPSVPALGYTAVFLTPAASLAGAPHTHASTITHVRTGSSLRGVGDSVVTNGIVSLTIASATGMVSSYSNAVNGITAPLTQSIFYYNASDGVHAPNDDTSGYLQPSTTYIFRPNSSTLFPIGTGVASVTLVTGPVVNETRQSLAWASQVIRLWRNASSIEAEYTVGPVDIKDSCGKEVVTKWSTGWATNATWFTDSNGLDMIRRERNYRPTWPLVQYEPIAGNYFPLTARAHTTDAVRGNRFTIGVDRAVGCGSINDGELETMVHRRLLVDAFLGNGEPLNEPGLNAQGAGLIVRGTQWLSLDTPATGVRTGHDLSVNAMLRPTFAYAALNAGQTPADWVAQHRATFTAVAATVPAQLQLLTVQSLSPTSMLLRVQHLYEAGEDAQLSQNATIALAGLFTGFNITSAVEMNLAGSVPLTQVKQWTLKPQGQAPVTLPVIPPPPVGANLAITLSAMQIRTFVVTTTPQ